MVDQRTKLRLSEIPVLNNHKIYVYILLNSAGKVKVGKTTNIAQRVQSLSGSNSAGDKIEMCYCSSATYLKTLEKVMHLKMSDYRIENTEWFYYEKDTTGKTLYSSAVKLLKKLMNSKEYENCNITRGKYIEQKEKKA